MKTFNRVLGSCNPAEEQGCILASCHCPVVSGSLREILLVAPGGAASVKAKRASAGGGFPCTFEVLALTEQTVRRRGEQRCPACPHQSPQFREPISSYIARSVPCPGMVQVCHSLRESKLYQRGQWSAHKAANCGKPSNAVPQASRMRSASLRFQFFAATGQHRLFHSPRSRSLLA